MQGERDRRGVDPMETRRGEGRGRAPGRRELPDEPSPASPAPPVKKPPWPAYYIPLYFWTGGIAAGSWLAATAEDLAGAGDRELIRAARYIALAGVSAGTVLLILDLGRAERFLNMLRIVRSRSPMSLGAWALATFGGFVGAAAALQAAEDGGRGPLEPLAAWSRGAAGRAMHAAGLPFALFIGGYTGTLLTATATPAWARGRGMLGPLFLASSVSTGLAAVALALNITGRSSPASGRRLARAETVALAAELVLMGMHRQALAGLPSVDDSSALERGARWLGVAAGMAVPLALNAWKGWGDGFVERSTRRLERRGRSRRITGQHASGQRASKMASAAGLLVLAGGLALRLLSHREGRRSADEPRDTWRFAEVAGGAAAEVADAAHG